jgi:hypothetical protein
LRGVKLGEAVLAGTGRGAVPQKVYPRENAVWKKSVSVVSFSVFCTSQRKILSRGMRLSFGNSRRPSTSKNRAFRRAFGIRSAFR